jgi:hypothetical protein
LEKKNAEQIVAKQLRAYAIGDGPGGYWRALKQGFYHVGSFLKSPLGLRISPGEDIGVFRSTSSGAPNRRR